MLSSFRKMSMNAIDRYIEHDATVTLRQRRHCMAIHGTAAIS
jgi:hypothetical protein